VGPRHDGGPRADTARRRGVAITPVAKGATSGGTGASATGRRGPEWPLPPGAPGQCSPQSGQSALPPPVVTARPEHLLVQDPEGSRPWRSPGRRGSPCPTLAPQCIGGLQLWVPRCTTRNMSAYDLLIVTMDEIIIDL
jgi:hypothetical protein